MVLEVRSSHHVSVYFILLNTVLLHGHTEIFLTHSMFDDAASFFPVLSIMNNTAINFFLVCRSL